MQYISDEDYKTAKKNGIHKNLVYQRVHVCHWDVEEAITREVVKGQKSKKVMHLLDHAINNGINLTYGAVVGRMNKGYNDHQIVWIRKNQRPNPNWDQDYKKYEQMAVENDIPASEYERRVNKELWAMHKAATMSLKQEKITKKRVAQLNRKQIG
ncbi:ferritin heavy chain-like [Oceanobacillus picturae]|uniref:Ferritin heavy chain-like n=1 Tax=Oceanobacillus picturae TaxID=171693 RepID=A0A0U9H5K6_9BACI|nr:hypothetical protein [Oceanobacillus picturae]GAQ18005.1 ferritin heavy chain-like [Oceanobacillus picturae]